MTGEGAAMSSTDRLHLSEHDQSDWVTLSDPALDALEEIEAESSGTRIAIEYGRGDAIRVHSSQFVGTISLPEGPEIHITPKAAGTNFLALLQYANGVRADTYDETTRATTGDTFVDALGALFSAELERLLTRAPHHEYQRVKRTEDRLRGQLDLQRQLQQQGPTATAFEVTFEELTSDTVANRGIHQAALRLTQLVESNELTSQLQRQHRQLRQWVSNEPVRVAQLSQVETSRLNDHYETILRLTEQVLRNSYLEDFAPTNQSSFGLLVNMNTVFEKAVERAATAVLDPISGWHASAQSRIDPIATGGNPAINMYPDTVLKQDGVVRLVGDAKWKTGLLRQSDIYQMTSYMLAHDVPGVLIFPEQDGAIETTYRIDNRQDLLVRELPTAHTPDKERFSTILVEGFRSIVEEVLTLSDAVSN